MKLYRLQIEPSRTEPLPCRAKAIFSFEHSEVVNVRDDLKYLVFERSCVDTDEALTWARRLQASLGVESIKLSFEQYPPRDPER